MEQMLGLDIIDYEQKKRKEHISMVETACNDVFQKSLIYENIVPNSLIDALNNENGNYERGFYTERGTLFDTFLKELYKNITSLNLKIGKIDEVLIKNEINKLSPSLLKRLKDHYEKFGIGCNSDFLYKLSELLIRNIAIMLHNLFNIFQKHNIDYRKIIINKRFENGDKPDLHSPENILELKVTEVSSSNYKDAFEQLRGYNEQTKKEGAVPKKLMLLNLKDNFIYIINMEE